MGFALGAQPRGGIVPTFGALTLPEAEELLQGLVAVDALQLQRDALQTAGTRLSGAPVSGLLRERRITRTPPSSIDHWRTVREVGELGGGDDVALAAGLTAESIVSGRPRRARLPSSVARGRRTIRPRLGRIDLEEAERLLLGLYGMDLLQLRQGVPPISEALHRGRLRYVRWDPDEHWQTVREIWASGGGDCEDLAAAVAAELTLRGVPSRPTLYRVRPGLAHAVTLDVELGIRVDPSRTGGMGQA